MVAARDTQMADCNSGVVARAQADVLFKRSPVAPKPTADAILRVGIMNHDDAEDCPIRAQEAANSRDDRKEGVGPFIDKKSYKPGVGAYDKELAPA